MGLNGNPFRVADESELAKLYVAPMATGDKSAHEIARSSDPVTQIIAPRGWGKSTLLFALREEFETLGVRCHYAYCSPKKPVRWQVPDVATRAVLIDEAQRLGQRTRRRVRHWREQTGGRIVTATHEDLSEDLGPSIHTVHLPAADAELIARMFLARVQWAGGAMDRFHLTPDAACWLAGRAAGSLRWTEELCYELFQRLERHREVTIDAALLQRIDHWRKER